MPQTRWKDTRVFGYCKYWEMYTVLNGNTRRRETL